MARCHQWLQLHSILYDHYVLMRLLIVFLPFKCHIELRDSTVKVVADEHESLVASMPAVEWKRGWGTKTKLL